jgi:hypothetical protein
MLFLRDHRRAVSRRRGRPAAADVPELPGRPGPRRRAAGRYDPGQPYLQWTCALCPQQVFWGRDLEGHTAQHHPGWTATFEIVQPYPRQVLRVVYRRTADQGSGRGA